MKILRLGIFMFFVHVQVYAQKLEPKFYDSLPKNIKCELQTLEQIFLQKEKDTLTINFTDNFILKGTVVQAQTADSVKKTIIVRVSNYKNMLLSSFVGNFI
jgi:hypothetical protein